MGNRIVRVIVTVACALGLALGSAGCKETSGDANCDGQESVVRSKYRSQDTTGDRGNMWMITMTCKGEDPTGWWFISWDESDGNPEKGIGPDEWEQAKVGQPLG